MGIIKQLFCKHEWVKTTHTEGSMMNLKTGYIHKGLTREFNYCKKCDKKELRIVNNKNGN